MKIIEKRLEETEIFVRNDFALMLKFLSWSFFVLALSFSHQSYVQ